ncbi:MAG: chromate efflux transporter [Ilumatobacteraceae bacterium]
MSSLADLARVFLRLGVTGFGGPAAHIAMMREEFVGRRGDFDDNDFASMIGAVNLVPGPNSTELAMHIGQRRAGGKGLAIAGVAFIVPAVLLVGALSWLYEMHGTNPAVVDVRWGVLPVIVAIVAHATWALGTSTLRSGVPFVVAAIATVSLLLGINELLVLIAGGALSTATAWKPRGAQFSAWLTMVAVVADASLHRVFFVFLEIGAVLYGSGYVLVAFLEGRIVDHLGWLTTQQVLDAVAIGQITPGPVFSTATFIGWQVAGVWGATAATVGIFAPSFLFVAFLGRIIDWLRRHPSGARFLDGVTAASLGLMAGALVRLAGAAFVDLVTGVIGLVSVVLLVTKRASTTALVTAGVALGALRLVTS